MNEPLTEDELGLILAALEFRGGYRPKPEYLPDCERLVERGWLHRDMVDGHARYELTTKAARALELNHMMSSAVTVN